ncbi:MAG: ABC-2 family transporter protein [Patescibacteria group bacterium]
MKEIKRLVKVWLLMSRMAMQTQITSFLAALFFILGKVVRFVMFYFLIFTVLKQTNNLAGYNTTQVIFFFLIFNLSDIVAQFLFRGVYVFRPLVLKGDFDLHLLQPKPSFFQPIFGRTDILDFVVLVPLAFYSVFYAASNGIAGSFASWILFFALFINGILISFSFHLFVCSIGILTLAVDFIMEIYRDFFNLARFPTDIYSNFTRIILTFVFPVVLMVTVPAKALMGLLSWYWLALSFLITVIFVFGSFKFWKYSLTKYSSASN